MMGSCKLFYFQRHGEYSDHDPSLTKTLIAALLNFLLLAGNLYSLILISSYYQPLVFLVIGVSSFVHCFCLSAVYREKAQLEKLHLLNEFGMDKTNYIFWMSVFTSWVSPCTVWANNKGIKKYFLLSSSAITIAVNMLSITVVYTLVSTVGLMDNVNPPISHCYQTKDIFNATNYRFHDSYNSSHQIFNICGSDDCLPTIRMCPENESILENYDFWCFITGVILLLISAGASVCLQILASYEIKSKESTMKTNPS
jgi:hypothetical protein